MNGLRPLRPLTTGEVLDHAFAAVRRQFWPLFVVVLGFQLVNHGCAKALELYFYARFPGLMNLSHVLQTGSSPFSLADSAHALGMLGLYLEVAFLLWQLALAALALRPGDDLGQLRVEPARVYARLLPRLPALLATALLESALLALASALGFLPGVLAVVVAVSLGGPASVVLALGGLFTGGLISLGAFLMVLLRYILVPHAVVVEGQSLFGALGRSAELMRGRAGQRFWDLPKIRGSLLVLVIGLVSNAVVLVLSAPQAVISLSSQQGEGGQVGLVWRLLGEALAVCGESAAAPFGLLVLAAFYLDLRVRREGLDLELAADRLLAAARPGGAPP